MPALADIALRYEGDDEDGAGTRSQPVDEPSYAGRGAVRSLTTMAVGRVRSHPTPKPAYG